MQLKSRDSWRPRPFSRRLFAQHFLFPLDGAIQNPLVKVMQCMRRLHILFSKQCILIWSFSFSNFKIAVSTIVVLWLVQYNKFVLIQLSKYHHIAYAPANTHFAIPLPWSSSSFLVRRQLHPVILDAFPDAATTCLSDDSSFAISLLKLYFTFHHFAQLRFLCSCIFHMQATLFFFRSFRNFLLFLNRFERPSKSSVMGTIFYFVQSFKWKLSHDPHCFPLIFPLYRYTIVNRITNKMFIRIQSCVLLYKTLAPVHTLGHLTFVSYVQLNIQQTFRLYLYANRSRYSFVYDYVRCVM